MADQFQRTELPEIAVIPAGDGFPEIRVVGNQVPATGWRDVRAPASPTPAEAPPPPVAPDWQPDGGAS